MLKIDFQLRLWRFIEFGFILNDMIQLIVSIFGAKDSILHIIFAMKLTLMTMYGLVVFQILKLFISNLLRNISDQVHLNITSQTNVFRWKLREISNKL